MQLKLLEFMGEVVDCVLIRLIDLIFLQVIISKIKKPTKLKTRKKNIKQDTYLKRIKRT